MCEGSGTSFEGIEIINWEKWNGMYPVRSSECSSEVKSAIKYQNIDLKLFAFIDDFFY